MLNLPKAIPIIDNNRFASNLKEYFGVSKQSTAPSVKDIIQRPLPPPAPNLSDESHMSQVSPDLNLMEKLHQFSPPPAPNLSDQLHKPRPIPAPNLMEKSPPPSNLRSSDILTLKKFYQFLMYQILGMTSKVIVKYKYKSEYSLCHQGKYLGLL